ncbi:hypothetical protein PO909_001096 [Leuciscus waleckii]
MYMFSFCQVVKFVSCTKMSLGTVGSRRLPIARLLGAALCESPAQFIGLMMLENHMRMSPTHSRQHRKGLDIK